MKYLLSIILFLMTAIGISAQRYHVYSVSGKVTDTNSKKNVLPKQILSDGSKLTLGEGARLVLINEKEKEMYTIKGPTQGTVSVLAYGKTTTTKSITPQYMAMILKKSSTNKVNRNTFMQSAATSFREIDSLKSEEKSPAKPVKRTDITKSVGKKKVVRRK